MSKKLPLDYNEYFYNYQLSLVKKVKQKFIDCNELLYSENNPIAKTILIEEYTNDEEKADKIYKDMKYKYDSFLIFCDKILKKEISDEDEYKNYINLMIIVLNEISIDYNEFLLSSRSKLLKKKYVFENKKAKLSYIISQVQFISYSLIKNQSQFNLFIDQNFRPIISIIMLAFLLFTYNLAKEIIKSRMFLSFNSFLVIIFLSGTLFLTFQCIIYHKKINIIQKRASFNKEIVKYCKNPMLKKYKFKDVFGVLKQIADLWKEIKS